ncbi:hypothetical protein D9M68_915080 [compost metagenome]
MCWLFSVFWMTVPVAVPAIEVVMAMLVAAATVCGLVVGAVLATKVLPGPFCTSVSDCSSSRTRATQAGVMSATRAMLRTVSVISSPLMNTDRVMPNDTSRPLPKKKPPRCVSSVRSLTACHTWVGGAACTRPAQTPSRHRHAALTHAAARPLR